MVYILRSRRPEVGVEKDAMLRGMVRFNGSEQPMRILALQSAIEPIYMSE